jgi:hypothetical protein
MDAPTREQTLVYGDELDEAIQAAIARALGQILITERRALDEFTLRFDDAEPFFHANEALGIHSTRIEHLPGSIPATALGTTARALIGAGARVVDLDDSIGWAFVVFYEGTREAAFGIRTDGTMYPTLAPPAVQAPTLPGVTVHGDSLTEGIAAYAHFFTALLPNRSFAADGIGGQQTLAIAARQGGQPAYVTVDGGVLPASGSVAVTINGVSLLSPPTRPSTRSRLGVIAGVPGTLLNTAAADGTNAYTFTRTTAGTPVPVPPLTPFITGVAERKTIPILAPGRNDLGSGPIGGGAYGFRTPLATLIANIEKMLDYSAHRGRAVIMPPLPHAAYDRGWQLDANHPYNVFYTALRTTFGFGFADWGGWLRSDAAFAVVGISKTSQDIIDINDGITPISFRGDDIHLVLNGYKASAPFFASAITSKD